MFSGFPWGTCTKTLFLSVKNLFCHNKDVKGSTPKANEEPLFLSLFIQFLLFLDSKIIIIMIYSKRF